MLHASASKSWAAIASLGANVLILPGFAGVPAAASPATPAPDAPLLAPTAPSAPGSAAGGGTIRFEIEFFAGDAAQPVNRATVFAAGRKVRIEQRRAGEAPPIFVYRGDRGRLYSIAETTRSYVELEPALLAKLGGGTTRDARREVDDGLAGLPQDQQRAFGHLLGVAPLDPKRADEPLVVSRTGATGSVSGIACERVELSRGRRLLAEGCIADWDAVGLVPEDVEVFRSLADLVRNATGSRMPIPIELVPGQPLDLVVQFGGLPLVFERAGDARGASAIRVTSVERIEGGEALFEVPAGFASRRGASALAGLASLLSPRAGASRAVPAAPAPWSGAEGGDESIGAVAPGPAERASATAGTTGSSEAAGRARVRRAFEARRSATRIVYRPIRLFEDGRE